MDKIIIKCGNQIEEIEYIKKADIINDDEMDSEKQEEEKLRFKRKKTQQKPVEKKDGDVFDDGGNDSPVPSGTGNREFNDMSPKDPMETKFVH